MPKFDSSISRIARNWKGYAIEVPAIYRAGQTVTFTDGEAYGLNTYLGEQVYNKLATKLQKMSDAGAPLSDAQKLYDREFSDYELTVGRSSDPVATEMRKIGYAACSAYLKAQGHKVTNDALKEEYERFLPEFGEKWKAKAQAVVALRDDDDLIPTLD